MDSSLRRSVAVLFCGALVSTASAARLPTGTLDVQVLSVEKETYRQEVTKYEPHYSLGSTGFVANVLIRAVVNGDFKDLSPGQTLKVHFEVSTVDSRPVGRTARRPLTPVGNATIEICCKVKDGEYKLRP